MEGTFTTLRLEWVKPHVLEVALNRPSKSNAINGTMWQELQRCFGSFCPSLPDLRCVLVTGLGKNFCAGLDLAESQLLSEPGTDVARTALRLRRHILELQASFSAIEALAVPVLACVHGACYGAGLDMISACDIRWACEVHFHSTASFIYAPFQTCHQPSCLASRTHFVDVVSLKMCNTFDHKDHTSPPLAKFCGFTAG